MADFPTVGHDEKDPTRQNFAIRQIAERLPNIEETAAAAAVATTLVIAGAGLTGGGTLEADRTFAVGGGTGITVNADDVALSDMPEATLKGRAAGAGTGAPGNRTGGEVRTIAGVEYGLQTIWVPAAAMGLCTTAPARGTHNVSTLLFDVLDFDQTTSEVAMFTVTMPKSWDKGNLFFQPYWTAGGGAGTVDFQIGGYAVSNDDALNQGNSFQATSSDTLIAASDLHVGPLSSGFTPNGSPANDDMLYFVLCRDTSTDTLNIDARLIGIKLLYTVNAGNDS